MIVLPDTHGRTFWKDAVRDREEEDIVFLGDYLDPYARENISRRDAIENFYEIIDFKSLHPQNITLLLGNHDMMTYISEEMGSCRTDFVNVDLIRRIFVENHDLFQMGCTRQINGQRFAFTHAGILRNWAEDPTVSPKLGVDTDNIEAIIERMNQMWTEEDPELFDILNHVSFFRGGDAHYGSPVWADVDEWDDSSYEYDGWYQVFGHSQMAHSPMICQYWANLDCRRAFSINHDGKIDFL